MGEGKEGHEQWGCSGQGVIAQGQQVRNRFLLGGIGNSCLKLWVESMDPVCWAIRNCPRFLYKEMMRFGVM